MGPLTSLSGCIPDLNWPRPPSSKAAPPQRPQLRRWHLSHPGVQTRTQCGVRCTPSTPTTSRSWEVTDQSALSPSACHSSTATTLPGDIITAHLDCGNGFLTRTPTSHPAIHSPPILCSLSGFTGLLEQNRQSSAPFMSPMDKAWAS